MFDAFIPVLRGFGLSVLVEVPILLIALSPRHGWRWRLFAGFWLTACTYPVVALVLPYLLSPSDSRGAYLLAAETFAPLAECCLFWLAFDRGQPCRRSELLRNFGAIVGANLVSFGLGVLLWG